MASHHATWIEHSGARIPKDQVPVPTEDLDAARADWLVFFAIKGMGRVGRSNGTWAARDLKDSSWAQGTPLGVKLSSAEPISRPAHCTCVEDPSGQFRLFFSLSYVDITALGLVAVRSSVLTAAGVFMGLTTLPSKPIPKNVMASFQSQRSCCRRRIDLTFCIGMTFCKRISGIYII